MDYKKKSHLYIGKACLAKADYERAIEELKAGLKIVESVPDRKTDVKVTLAYSLTRENAAEWPSPNLAEHNLLELQRPHRHVPPKSQEAGGEGEEDLE